MRRREVLGAAAGAIIATDAYGQGAQRFVRAAQYSYERNGVSFLVMRNGVVLGEHYRDGAPDVPRPIRNATRAFSGVLAAVLVREGVLSLDEPVAMTLGLWGADAMKADATIRHLLNLTCGVAMGEGAPPLTESAIAAPAQAAAGQRFLDGDGPYQIFGEVVRRKLTAMGQPSDPSVFLESWALNTVGCRPILWRRGGDGHVWLGDGAEISARSWAQFGEFVRRRGVWRASEIVSETALSENFIGSFASQYRYGLGWWLASAPRTPAPFAPGDSDFWSAPSAVPFDAAMAAGAGEQRLYIIPSRRAVIVRQALAPEGRGPQPAWSDAAFLSLVLADL